MFESDDFDEVLSQFDLPGGTITGEKHLEPFHNAPDPQENYKLLKIISKSDDNSSNNELTSNDESSINLLSSKVIFDRNQKKSIDSLEEQHNCDSDNLIDSSKLSKNTKRKMLTSLFDHKSKRKFPGPAGLLSGSLESNHNENLCQIELLSQDVDFSQNTLGSELFESDLWIKISKEVKTWNLGNVDSIKTIKQQALSDNLRYRKAQVVTAFIETVDRSVADPLITLRDISGNIKCTLHRDAWSNFSSYIVAECCALVLCKPTVLTTGSTFKKHYLNITLRNIYAIYSTTKFDDEKPLPENYGVIHETDVTIIKNQIPLKEAGSNINSTTNDFEDLDSIFFEEIF